MAQITLKNVTGADAGHVDLDEATFGIQPNVPVMHQVVTAQLAARRAGTQSTKTRAEVRGGGAKPYRQKGTGNARQGSIRGPHYSGGGVALGPKPRKYGQKTPKKMISLALRSALSDRAAEGKVVVVDEWGWTTPNTKVAVKALGALGIDGRVLVVVGRDDAATALSFRNIPEVQLIAPGELNAYDVLCNDWIVFTRDVLPAYAAARPSSVKTSSDAASTDVTASTEGSASDEADAAHASEANNEHGGSEADDETAIQRWAGSVVADEDGSGPETHLIKGNANSMLYHVPGSSFYNRTKAEVWFDTEESAEAAGFSKPASQQKADDDEPASGTESES